MLGIKTKSQDAEKIRKYLINENLFRYGYDLIKEKSKITIPVKKIYDKIGFQKKFPKAEIVDTRFIKTQKKQDYKDILKKKIDTSLLPSSFDIIGDIIIIDITDEIKNFQKEIGEALLLANKNIKTILKKSGMHEGEFRTQKLSYVAGINTKETVYKENNVRLKLDVEKVYFSPRLSKERKRIYQLVKQGENVLVMFSGSAPYPCVIAKNTGAKEIIGIEKNPIGHKYGIENIALNKLKNVTLYNGDVLDVIPKLKKKFNRILMPLPKGAEDFLDLALSATKKGSIVHFYDFEHETELSLGEEKVKRACKKNKIKFKILNTVKCGQYSPGKFRICIDFKVCNEHMEKENEGNMNKFLRMKKTLTDDEAKKMKKVIKEFKKD